MTWPNFFIIGAGRSGTTSLHNYLSEHPEVFMSKVKETNFFSFLVGAPPMAGRVGEAYFRRASLPEERDYLRAFAGAEGHKAIGESSPSYLAAPGVPEAIRERVPKARLIAILRNPVDRSHRVYLGRLRNRWESVPFIDAFRRDRHDARPSSLVVSSKYHAHLTRYFAVFPADQIKVFLWEDLKADSRSLMREVHDFLGVDPTFVPKVEERHNPTGVIENPLLNLIWRTPPGPREFIRSRMPRRLEAAVYGLLKRNLITPKLSPEIRAEVAREFREDITKLQDLLRRDLSAWLTPSS